MNTTIDILKNGHNASNDKAYIELYKRYKKFNNQIMDKYNTYLNSLQKIEKEFSETQNNFDKYLLLNLKKLDIMLCNFKYDKKVLNDTIIWDILYGNGQGGEPKTYHIIYNINDNTYVIEKSDLYFPHDEREVVLNCSNFVIFIDYLENKVMDLKNYHYCDTLLF
jgi:hypothetical protein